MGEVEIKFENEGLTGIVAVGTYVLDAAKRLGLRFEDKCRPEEGVHFCSLQISNGGERLSPLTSAEEEHFAEHGRKSNERLGCQAKFDEPGEVVIMTEKKKAEASEEKAEEKSEQYKKDFVELPLEKKLADLVHLEAIALSETVSFIVNSPFKIGEKIMDVMAEFGLKKETEEKEAVRPEEHKANGAEGGAKAKAPGKKTAKQKPAGQS